MGGAAWTASRCEDSASPTSGRHRAAARAPPRLRRRRRTHVATADRRPRGRVHGGGLGRARRRCLVRPARGLRHGRLRRLPGRFRRSPSACAGRTWSGCRSVVRSPSRSPAGTRPVPRTLVLASGYAGWAGSLSAEIADQRLQQALALSELAPRTSSPHCSRRCSRHGRLRSRSMRFAGSGPSTRPASGPWPGRRPRTSATCWPTSRCPRWWSPATRTCGRPGPWPTTSTRPSPVRRWSCWPAPVTSATSKPPEAFNQAVRSFLRARG